jgi:hypothetical protein
VSTAARQSAGGAKQYYEGLDSAPSLPPNSSDGDLMEIMLLGSLSQLRFSRAIVTLAFASVACSLTHASLIYTCDPTVSASACSGLNTTISDIYDSTFDDVSANIYIGLGPTSLGMSSTFVNFVHYEGAQGYRTTLIADQTSADDRTAVAGLPIANPIPGTAGLLMTNANIRALPGLGLTPRFGLQSDGLTRCSLGPGCYDGVITISQGANLWLRADGPQAANQYDFYSLAEHETDEILGTGSGAFGHLYSANSAFAPMDLFRYQSNGMRSFGASNNRSCAANNTGNACFSLDGVAMLLQFNNVDNGQDAGDFSTSCQYVQDAFGCIGGSTFHDINADAEIKMLDVIGYTTAVPEPATISVLGVGLSILAAAGYERSRSERLVKS